MLYTLHLHHIVCRIYPIKKNLQLALSIIFNTAFIILIVKVWNVYSVPGNIFSASLSHLILKINLRSRYESLCFADRGN